MNQNATLADIVDELLDYANEDDERFVKAIIGLSPEIRSELLISDFLNAYQVYIYLFREIPDEMITDRLLLQPASSLEKGTLLEERGLVELMFLVQGESPIVQVRIEKDILATFKGKDAHRLAIRFAEEFE